MKEQNYSNHIRFVLMYHLVLYFLLLIALVASVINFITSLKGGSNLYEAGVLVIFSFTGLITAWYSRVFALAAHDKAIRAEENLRHYVLTGKLLDGRLKMSQIVALRFAPDEEFVALAKKAVDEKLKSSDIKKLIKNWKPDHNRV
jgi:FlaA1/EpsC-like NDP-sugar epimerase